MQEQAPGGLAIVTFRALTRSVSPLLIAMGVALLPGRVSAGIVADGVFVVDGNFDSFDIPVGPGDTDIGNSLAYFLPSSGGVQARVAVDGGSSLRGGRLITGTFGATAATDPPASVTVTGAGSNITLTRGPGGGAFDLASQGRGTVLVQDGGRIEYVTLTGTCAAYECGAGALTNGAGSSGTLVVTGAGSVFDANPAEDQFFRIGAAGTNGGDFGEPGADSTASVSILDGGRLETGWALVAAQPGPGIGNTGEEAVSATVAVAGATSVWSSDRIAVGFELDDPLAPAATGSVFLEGGTIEARESYIGPTGTLAGVGTVTGDVYNLGGQVAPGLSPGRLAIDGDFIMNGGELVLELAGFADPLKDILDVSGLIDISGGDIIFDFLGFTPGTGDLFDPLRAGEGINLGEGVNLVTRGLAPGFDFDFTDGVLIALNDARAVPAPATAWLLLIALFGAGAGCRHAPAQGFMSRRGPRPRRAPTRRARKRRLHGSPSPRSDGSSPTVDRS